MKKPILTFNPAKFIISLIITGISVAVCGWWSVLFLVLIQVDIEFTKGPLKKLTWH